MARYPLPPRQVQPPLRGSAGPTERRRKQRECRHRTDHQPSAPLLSPRPTWRPRRGAEHRSPRIELTVPRFGRHELGSRSKSADRRQPLGSTERSASTLGCGAHAAEIGSVCSAGTGLPAFNAGRRAHHAESYSTGRERIATESPQCRAPCTRRRMALPEQSSGPVTLSLPLARPSAVSELTTWHPPQARSATRRFAVVETFRIPCRIYELSK